jgi:uncharacterized protein (DUF433 family)
MTDEQKLIDKHVDESRGIANARLHHGAVPVWALVGYLEAAKGDKRRVAKDYDLSDDEVRAALSYYKRHKAAIDARIEANAVV